MQYGLNVLDHFQGPPTINETLRMRLGGATVIRVGFGWGRLQPRRGPFQWNHFDSVMASTAYGDVEVLPILVGVPNWIPHHARGWPDTRKGLARYAKYVKAIAGRYGRGGTFWRTHPSIPYKPIKQYEVWSEQNRADMAPKGPKRAKYYFNLLRVTRDALDARDRRAKIMVGGMNQRKIRLSVRATNFLGQIYAMNGAKKLIDSVGVHPYGGNSTDPVRITQIFRRTLKKAGAGDVPLWITELGWGTGGETGGHPLVVDEAGQATKLFLSLTDLAANAQRLNLDGVLWYSFLDILAPSSGGTWDQHAGLFTQSGAKKPGWDAFARVTGGTAGGDLTPQDPPPYIPSS